MKVLNLILLVGFSVITFSPVQSQTGGDIMKAEAETKKYVTLDEFIDKTLHLCFSSFKFYGLEPGPMPEKWLVIGIDKELWQNEHFLDLVSQFYVEEKLELEVYAPFNDDDWGAFVHYQALGIKISPFYIDEKISQCHLIAQNDRFKLDVFSDKNKFIKEINTIYRRVHYKRPK